ncbi:MAG: hypothetical protein GX921_07835 [Bacteroidales bacterium]|nr:hypothetical protein [Bacteroidales bacterium]
MNDLSNMAVIGSGPTALYLLRYIWEHIAVLKNKIQTITVFEKEEFIGTGMPYNTATTDIYNLSNISSEEIPMLQESFGDWLRKQSRDALRKLNIDKLPISDTEVYARVALGHYFHDQFKQLINALESRGVRVIENSNCEVVDITQVLGNELIVTDCYKKQYVFSTVVIANGHAWKGEDKVEAGYFASPWPIHKILPQKDKFFNFTIGVLGASLSAFDVVTSLAHRHGVFTTVDDKLKFTKHKKAPEFKIVLHSTRGWLPHLQYEQQEPIREIYRHFDRDQMLQLIDDSGFIRIEDFFNELCRAPLSDAFRKDKLMNVVEKLQSKSFTFRQLVALLTERHAYINSFEGMRQELNVAKKHRRRNTPVYWMETLDDLMYSLNYHAELLPAEDHLFLHKEIMWFLMNVIAALPLQSAEILLALYDASCIELKSGLVTLDDTSFVNNKTKIDVESEDGCSEEIEYRLFVNCSGQKKLEIDDFPFKSLVEKGVVRCATAKFADTAIIAKGFGELNSDAIVDSSQSTLLKISGVDIDSCYRTINKKGLPNNFLYDINFTHTNGLRPYSYGLQACSATSHILVESWIAAIEEGKDMSSAIESITELYEDTEGL